MKLTLKQFLEATGDKTVDSMITRAKIRAGAALDDPNTAGLSVDDAERQQELEKWVRDELDKIDQIPAQKLGSIVRELKPIADEYPARTNPLELLYLTASSKDESSFRYGQDPDTEHELNLQDVADSFLTRHRDKIKDAMAAWLVAFSNLRGNADDKKWPKPNWQRSTSYDSRRYYASTIAKELSHWFK